MPRNKVKLCFMATSGSKSMNLSLLNKIRLYDISR